MDFDDDEQELTGYQPTDRPLRGRGFTVAMRAVVVVGLASLMLPGALYTYSVQKATAERSCAALVAYTISGPSGSEAHFEFFGPGLIGWECYSQGAFGGDSHVASLGLIPGPPRIGQPPSRTQSSSENQRSARPHAG